MSTKCRNSSVFVPLTTLRQLLEARVFLEELRVSQLVQKFPEFYKTGRFITVFTTAPIFSLLEPEKSSPYLNALCFRSSLILSSHTHVAFFFQVPSQEPCRYFSLLQCVPHALPISLDFFHT